MKRSSRTLLSLLLVLSLCLGMMPMSIFADEGTPAELPEASETVEELQGAEEAAEEEPAVTEEPAEEEPAEEQEAEEPAAEEPKIEAAEPAEEEKKAEEVTVEASEEDLGDAADVETETEEEAGPAVEFALKATMQKSSGWYSDFHLGYTNANGNEAIIGKPTNDMITPPSYSEFPPGCPYTEDQFVGWNWNGSRIDFSSSHFMPNSSYQFYAVWKKEGETWVNVTFRTGLGDNEAIYETQIKSGEKASMTPPPSNSYNTLKSKGYKGFRFAENWFLLDDLLNLKSDFDYENDWELVKDARIYYFDYNHTIEKDSVFVPKWIKTWEVTFVDEAGETVCDPVIVDNNGTVSRPEIIVQEGYEYSWYYLDETGAECTFEFKSTPVTRDLQLHLRKTAVSTVKYYMVYPDGFVDAMPYTVVYPRNENADESAAETFEVATFEETGFKNPPGYVFKGWKVVTEDPSPVQIQPGTGNWGGQEVLKKPALMPAAKMRSNSRLADSEDTAVKENDPDVIVQPGDELELHANVYLVPVWGATPLVIYHTEYPLITGLKNDWASPHDIKDTDETFTVLTFEEAFKGTDNKVPAGFKFVRWQMVVSDEADDDFFVPEEGTVTPGVIVDHGASDQARRVVAKEAKKEKIAITDMAPLNEESAAYIPETAWSNEAENASDEAGEQVTPTNDGQEMADVYPGDTEDLHLRVHLYAVWEPYFKVIYHRVMPESDFAKDKGIEDDTFEVDYSSAQYKEAEGMFTVLDYSATKLEGIPGYEFDYWTMDWDDLYKTAQSDPRPEPKPEAKPELEAEYKEQAAKEQLSVEAKDAKQLRAASSSENEEAVKVIVAEKEKVDTTEKEKVDVTENDKIDTTEKEKIEKIMPGDEEELHFVVHLYAWWKEKPYTVIWIDWTKDGGSVDKPLTTGEYKPEQFDPEKFDPEIEYKENKGPVREPKVIDGVTYQFDHWELRENEDDHTLVYEAIYKAPYNVVWIDEGGDVKDPLTTGGYNEYDPDTFDPAKEYEANKGPELKDKVVDGKTYTFDHWEPKENVDDNTFVYEAAYKPVEQPANPTNPGRPNSPSTPTTNTPTEEVTEIGNDPTPLAPATEEPVEEEGEEEVGESETPLAGFEVDPEEDEEVAEEALPLTPFTGDERNTAVWLMISILSLLGIVLVARRRREE